MTGIIAVILVPIGIYFCFMSFVEYNRPKQKIPAKNRNFSFVFVGQSPSLTSEIPGTDIDAAVIIHAIGGGGVCSGSQLQ
jgi:hypothetical protein